MTAIDGAAPGVSRLDTASDSGARGERVSLGPASAYEVVTRQMVLGMHEELREIKARLNGLLFMVAGSVLLELVTRVMG